MGWNNLKKKKLKFLRQKSIRASLTNTKADSTFASVILLRITSKYSQLSKDKRKRAQQPYENHKNRLGNVKNCSNRTKSHSYGKHPTGKNINLRKLLAGSTDNSEILIVAPAPVSSVAPYLNNWAVTLKSWQFPIKVQMSHF